MGNGKAGHLNADQKVLNSGSKIVPSVAVDIIGNGAEPDKDREEKALPVRGKYDELDAKEFRHRPEGLQVMMHANPEQAQRVQADRHADVVDNADIKVARIGIQVALLIGIGGFQDNRCQGKDRLEPCVLQDAALYSKECVGVGDIDTREDVVEGPQMMDRLSTMHHDDEGSFAANVIYQKLKEGVYRESLEKSARHATNKS
jgi:hypothetical protein